MQDRFKFRAWNIIVERFQYFDFKELSKMDYEDIQWHILNFQQSTGLKDKNGKLIYEGDILSHPQLPHKVVCEWVKDGFWLNGFMNGAKRELRSMHNWYEVIGNVYENKELLNE